ncbi:hypothetical protein LWI28_002780 [Acer negundo]|uniref:Uncharacterized protein n=1 Tax=Acer negundo TaxID=4023 RepID=A0AAD5JCH0_ACENE|nr:hypothetical protein LWI28_002780 [Acer negundo]
MNKALNTEERYWKQRARVDWLKHGDINSRFFHAKATTRRTRSYIKGITDVEGRWREGDEEVENVISKYFSALFTTSNPPRTALETIDKGEYKMLPELMVYGSMGKSVLHAFWDCPNLKFACEWWLPSGLVSDAKNVEFRFVLSKANRVAFVLANEALKIKDVAVWREDAPMCIREQVEEEQRS